MGQWFRLAGQSNKAGNPPAKLGALLPDQLQGFTSFFVPEPVGSLSDESDVSPLTFDAAALKIFSQGEYFPLGAQGLKFRPEGGCFSFQGRPTSEKTQGKRLLQLSCFGP